MEECRQRYAQWQEACRTITKQRKEMVRSLCREAKEQYIADTDATYQPRIDQSRQKLGELKERRAAAEAAQSSLGLFALKAKNEQRALLKQLDEALSKESEVLSMLEEEHRQALAKASAAVEKKRRAFKTRAEEEYVLPEEPADPAMKEYLSSLPVTKKPTPQERLQQKVLACMDPDRLYTADELLREMNDARLSPDKLTALLDKLVASQEIIRIRDKRKTYYQMA